MRNKRIIAASAALLIILGLNLTGCSKKAGPTNADIVKAAIQLAIKENCNILTPSISVQSKTINEDSASVTIGYRCAGLGNDGNERMMTMQLARSQGAAGHTTTWTVK